MRLGVVARVRAGAVVSSGSCSGALAGRLANLATKAGTEGTGRFRIHSPLLKLTKAEIIREGVKLGVDYAPTLSCYDPDATGRACGRCDSCLLRLKGFGEAGLVDPVQYS